MRWGQGASTSLKLPKHWTSIEIGFTIICRWIGKRYWSCYGTNWHWRRLGSRFSLKSVISNCLSERVQSDCMCMAYDASMGIERRKGTTVRRHPGATTRQTDTGGLWVDPSETWEWERIGRFISFVLSHSRYKYVEWLDRQFTIKDTVLCHENVFRFFGGMTYSLQLITAI
jgi:hypothetical protein